MKNNFRPVVFSLLFCLFFCCNSYSFISNPYPAGSNLYPQYVYQFKFLDANNIRTSIYNTGMFNQDLRTSNSPGFEWPKGSNKFAIFTTGISLVAYVRGSDGVLRLGESMASYKGEWVYGYLQNGVLITPSYFHIFSVKAGDNNYSNPDYANWSQMIPFGAPFKDVNNNGVFDIDIDIPGMPNSAQTIFQCLTDADPTQHTLTEGFGGGVTYPLLKAEMHMTAWCYNTSGFEDIQFLKFEVINKNDSAWRKAFFGLIADPDIGDGGDDYIGCDTLRKLGFCYNADNVDNVYGTNPPAIGMQLLRGAFNRSVTPNVDLGMTSFTFFGGSLSCESGPNGDSLGAYNMIKGLKKDGSPFMNPTTTPYSVTKYCYSGNPVANTGWNEVQGSIRNCGGTTGNLVVPTPPGDRRFIISSGADNLVIRPNEKQTILMSQFIGRSTAKSGNGINSNLTAITVLKTMSDTIKNFYLRTFPVGLENISQIIPDKYRLYQNYPNPFNPVTSIKFDLIKSGDAEIKIYDILGKEVAVLVNEKFKAGSYSVNWDASAYPSGLYFYRLTTSEYTEVKKMLMVK